MKNVYLSRLLSLYAVLPFFVVCTFSGCNTGGNAAKEVHRLSEMSFRSTADIEAMLDPRMSSNQIVSTFGPPKFIEALGPESSVVEWGYSLKPFPASGHKEGQHVAGLVLKLTNNLLWKWSFSYVAVMDHEATHIVSVADPEPTTGDNNQRSPPQQMDFYIASTGTNLLRTPPLVPPVLRIQGLKDVSVLAHNEPVSESKPQKTFTFHLTFFSADAERIKQLTRTNVLKTLVIRINDEFFTAPTILAPIENGMLTIDSIDSIQGEKFGPKLIEMTKIPKRK